MRGRDCTVVVTLLCVMRFLVRAAVLHCQLGHLKGRRLIRLQLLLRSQQRVGTVQRRVEGQRLRVVNWISVSGMRETDAACEWRLMVWVVVREMGSVVEGRGDVCDKRAAATVIRAAVGELRLVWMVVGVVQVLRMMTVICQWVVGVRERSVVMIVQRQEVRMGLSVVIMTVKVVMTARGSVQEMQLGLSGPTFVLDGWG